MPYDDKGFAGLFIPTGTRSRSSSTETSSTSRLTTISSIAPLDSASTTDGSSIRTTTTTTATNTKSSTFIPSSGVRYTISAPANDTYGYTHRNPADVNNAKSAVRPQWHNMRGSPPPPLPSMPKLEPIVDAPHMVQVVAAKSSVACYSQSPRLLTCDSDEVHEQTIRITAPTPFTSPEATPVPEAQDRNSTKGDVPSSTGLTVTDSNSGMTIPQLRSRSQSPGSSKSSKQRVYPPGSFPSTFYQHVSAPQGPGNSSAHTSGLETTSKPVRPKANIYTISSPARSVSDYRPRSAKDHPDESLAAPQRPRNERSTSDHIVIRSSKPSGTSSPNVTRSTSSSSHSSTFHTTIHYYRSCLHTSPPKARPLDVQPVIEHSISSSSENQVSARSVIEGSCFDCDTSSRRDAETDVLVKHTPELSDLIAETRHLLNKLELGDSDQDESDSSIDEGTYQAKSSDDVPLRQQPSHNGDEGVTSDLFALQIYDLESRIAQLTDLRDRDIRRVWMGYTSRWGPGTLGVVQKTATKISRSNSERGVSTTRTTPTTQSSDVAGPIRKHERDRSRGSVSSRVTNSTTTTSITYDDGATPEGRMRVNWIRD